MADLAQSIVTRTLRQAGFWTFKAQDAVWLKGFSKQKLALPEESGKADLIACRNQAACFVEVKDGSDSFAFSSWRENQRAWAMSTRYEFGMDYWLAIVMGNDPPNYNPEKYRPRRMWLLPIEEFAIAESFIRVFQASIPYIAGKGYKTELQDMKYDAVTMWKSFELPWGKGVYRFESEHPFLKIFPNENPFVIPQEDDYAL